MRAAMDPAVPPHSDGSRGIARPAMGVRWGGEAGAVAQPAVGRREQAVPSALV